MDVSILTSLALTEESEDRMISEVLAWCNEIRQSRGRKPLTELPKGGIYDPSSCPCGKATGVWVERQFWTETREQWEGGARESWHLLPPVVQEFIIRFDREYFPGLIESK